MDVQELFDLVKESNNGEVKETIEDLVELLGNITNDPDKFAMKLDDMIEDYARENEVCPICGREFVTDESEESSEHFGCPCYETIGTRCCPEHGCVD